MSGRRTEAAAAALQAVLEGRSTPRTASTMYGVSERHLRRLLASQGHPDGRTITARRKVMNATSTPSSIPTTDSAVAAALRTHGASAVYLAAHYWLTGDRTRLPALGIPNPSNVAEADRICTQAFRLLTPAEQAADWAQLQAELRRLAKA